MNSRVLLLLLAVLLIGVAAWFLLSGEPPPPPPMDEDPARRTPSVSDPTVATTSPTTNPGGTTKPPPRNPPSRPETQKPVTATGSVLVVPVAPEGQAVPKDIVVDIEALGPALHAKPLPQTLEGDQYRYESVLVGKYRVRVWGDLWTDATAEVAVMPDQESRVEVPLLRGGLLTYKATIAMPGSDVVPENMTVSVLDGRKQPILARFQSRMPGSESSPHVDTSATLPPVGVVIGLKPGHYTLRGTAPGGESDEKGFDIKEGETVGVYLRLFR